MRNRNQNKNFLKSDVQNKEAMKRKQTEVLFAFKTNPKGQVGI